MQTVHKDLALFLRQMKSFVYGVGEERIFGDVRAERCAAYHVGVETQRPAFGLEYFTVVFDSDYLSGCYAHHCSFLIVVGLTAIYYVAAFHLFQENCVKAERMRA